MRITVIYTFIATFFLPFLGSNGEEILRRKREADAIDFRNAYDDPETGLKCVNKEASIQTKEQERLLECVHSKIKVCHYTYVTRFTSQRVEECDDHYEKICHIVFKNLPTNETIKHCYRPMVKECRDKGDGENDDNLICKTVFETECSTRYVEKQQNGESSQKKYVGLTACKKLPVELCGSQYCDFVPGEETCHNKTVTSVIPVPEESCDLVPQETCKGVYKLVPYLVPESQCKDVPREVCSYGVKSTQVGEKPLVTKWCYDPKEGSNPSEIVRTGGAREGSNNAVLKNFLSEEERSGLINSVRSPLNGRLPPPINAIIQNQGQKRPGDTFQLRGINGRQSNTRVSVNELRNINNANRNQQGSNAASRDKKPLDPFSNVFTILSGSEDGDGPRSVPTLTQIPARNNAGRNGANEVVTFGNKEINSQNGPFRTVINTNDRDVTTGPAPIPSEVEYFDQYEDFNVSPPIPTQETRPLTGKDDDTTPATTPKPFFVSQGGVVGTASADVQNELDLKFQVDEASLRQFDEFLKEYEANYEARSNDDVDFPEYSNYPSNEGEDSSSNAAKNVFPRSTTPRRLVSTTPNYDTEFEFISNEEQAGNDELTTPLPSLSPIRQRTPKKSNPNIRDNFEPLLKDDSGRAQVALTESVQDISKASKSSLARVIKHNDSESSIGQTIIIRNTPEAIKLFGIKNIPKEVFLRNGDANNFKIVHVDNDSSYDQAKPVKRTTTVPTTSTSTTTTPTPSPSTFSDVFFTRAATTTTTQKPKISSENLESLNSFGSFSSLLGIENEEFPVNDRVDRNVKDLPLIHFTTAKPSVLNANPASTVSFTSQRPPVSSIGQLISNESSNSTTTANPFVTRDTTLSISRGTPSWERSTTGSKITLKPAQLIVNQTIRDFRAPKTITFIRNPSITAIQGFASPDNSLQNQNSNNKEVTRQILDIGFQNTVKKHQSIIKPGKVSGGESSIRASRNPSQPFKAPPTLIYGFKPMTTPIGFLSTTLAPKSSRPKAVPQFSPPSNIHFGFRPMNNEHSGPKRNPITLESVQSSNKNSFKLTNDLQKFKNFNENLAQNNQVKRNVGRPFKKPTSDHSSPSVLDSIKDFLTSPFKKIIDNF